MSLVATLVQNSRVRTEMDKNELRIEQAGIFDTFRMQSDAPGGILTSQLKETALRSAGKLVKTPVLNFKDVTVRSTRPLTIAADENTSAFITFTFVTLAYGFKMYPAQHFNNEISYQEDFDHKYKAMIVKFIQTLEGLGATALNNAKTQVIGEVVGGHAFTSNVVSETGISTLKNSYILNSLAPMMASNDFYSMELDIIGNQSLRDIIGRMEGYGTYNEENKVLQLGSKRLHWSNQIANAAGKNATGYAVAPGTLGLLYRVEPDSLMRTKLDTSHEWDTINLPMLGIPCGTYYYEEAVNAASLASPATDHLTRTGAQVFDFAFDIGFVTAYNSAPVSIPSPIIKFDIDVD